MKTKISERAIEARIKRTLAEIDQKLKKKGNKYTVIDCKKNSIVDVYHDINTLAHSLDLLKEYEEIDIEIKPVYALSVAVDAAEAAKREIEKLIGLDFLWDDYKFEEELNDTLTMLIFNFLHENKDAENFPKNINLIFDEEALDKHIGLIESQVKKRVDKARAKVKENNSSDA